MTDLSATAPTATVPTDQPLAMLAALTTANDIAVIERDAGQIFHDLGKLAFNGKDPGKSVWYSMRNPNGTWSQVRCQQREAKVRYEAAAEAIRTDERRRVVVQALVAREPRFNPDSLHSLAAGLEDLTRHFWGAKAVATTKRNGVTLAGVPSIDNGPTPERMRQAANDNDPRAGGVFRSPFHRMFERGQLDKDEAINELLYSAGVRFYQDWYYSGLAGGLDSFDYSKPIVDSSGGESSHMPRTVREAARRQAWRAAVAILRPIELRVIMAVVLDEKTVRDAARPSGLRGDSTQIQKEAKELLVSGLRRLVKEYGLARIDLAA
jgi:hypothetical protein